MSGRFQLDPRAPAPKRAPPPAPPAPARPERDPAELGNPMPRPPAAGTAAPIAPRRDRRALVLVAVVVALLLVGGGFAAYLVGANAYPDNYVLETREYPEGLATARLSQSDMDSAGITSNPGAADEESLDKFATSSGTPPEQAYALILTDAGGARVIIFALKYNNEEEAKDFAKQGRAICSFANGVLLSDGDIVVTIIPEKGGSKPQVTSVARALLEKNSDLSPVCGIA